MRWMQNVSPLFSNSNSSTERLTFYKQRGKGCQLCLPLEVLSSDHLRSTPEVTHHGQPCIYRWECTHNITYILQTGLAYVYTYDVYGLNYLL